MDSEGEPVSKVIEHPASKGVQNTSTLNKFCFTEKLSNLPSGMPSRKKEMGEKLPKIVDLASTYQEIFQVG